MGQRARWLWTGRGSHAFADALQPGEPAISLAGVGACRCRVPQGAPGCSRQPAAAPSMPGAGRATGAGAAPPAPARANGWRPKAPSAGRSELSLESCESIRLHAAPPPAVSISARQPHCQQGGALTTRGSADSPGAHAGRWQGQWALWTGLTWTRTTRRRKTCPVGTCMRSAPCIAISTRAPQAHAAGHPPVRYAQTGLPPRASVVCRGLSWPLGEASSRRMSRRWPARSRSRRCRRLSTPPARWSSALSTVRCPP